MTLDPATKAPGHAHLRLATLINRSDREGGIDFITPPCPPLAPLILAAYGRGYTLAVHGSLHRDLDLIAVAWTDKASSADELVESLCSAEDLKVVGEWADKPHGRRAVTLQKSGWYKPIDLSVIPPTRPARARKAAAPIAEQARPAAKKVDLS